MVGFDLARGGKPRIEDARLGRGLRGLVFIQIPERRAWSGRWGFVHERHARAFDLCRLAGWWGHDKETRFLMGPEFKPLAGAEGWQVSNPPILQMAALRASLEIFDEAGMPSLAERSKQLTGHLETLIDQIADDRIEIITPRDPQQRGCQLSIRVKNADRSLHETLVARGVYADWREPDVIRVAPVPLYNSFNDVRRFAGILKSALND